MRENELRIDYIDYLNHSDYFSFLKIDTSSAKRLAIPILLNPLILR